MIKYPFTKRHQLTGAQSLSDIGDVGTDLEPVSCQGVIRLMKDPSLYRVLILARMAQKLQFVF